MSLAWSDTKSIMELVSLLPGDLHGLEIGTMRGGVVIDLLTNIPRIKSLIAIDPFKPYADIPILGYEIQEDWDKIYSFVDTEFKKFGNRAELVRGKSEDVYSRFSDKSLDFLFIDGDHSYQAVKRDLILYEPKLKEGGLLIGHDYSEGHKYMVVKAVDEYVKEHNRSMFFSHNSIYFWRV